jgi:hypothetical protein
VRCESKVQIIASQQRGVMKIFGKERKCPTCKSPNWEVIYKRSCRDPWHFCIVILKKRKRG